MPAVVSRTVLPLAGCQALLFAGNTIVVSTTALVGAQLAPTSCSPPCRWACSSSAW